MHVNLKQISFSYDKQGNEHKNVIKVPVEPCKPDFFKTKYEQRFWDTYKDSNLNCVDDNKIFI